LRLMTGSISSKKVNSSVSKSIALPVATGVPDPPHPTHTLQRHRERRIDTQIEAHARTHKRMRPTMHASGRVVGRMRMPSV
jgi:hypothetical protein